MAPVDFGVGTLIIQAHREWFFFYLFLSGALNITIRHLQNQISAEVIQFEIKEL